MYTCETTDMFVYVRGPDDVEHFKLSPNFSLRSADLAAFHNWSAMCLNALVKLDEPTSHRSDFFPPRLPISHVRYTRTHKLVANFAAFTHSGLGN